jgi:serine/threonine-protein kinase HipA
MMAERAVDVVVQIAGDDVLAGRLWSHRRRGTESQTFAYDPSYLGRAGAYAIDPALALHAGQQQTPAGRSIFGALSDAAPDRWGRTLIQRAERQRVRDEGGAARDHGEIDDLLGVRDDLRQGALRFRAAETTPFLADERGGVPQLVDLPRLLAAAEHLERDEETVADLAQLLRAGSSLGGARPKAHVREADGRIAIAKFPSSAQDDWDVMRWESVALVLAGSAGIRVPDSRLHVIDRRAVLVVDRFDRVGERRVGYVSAMTMLEVADGDRGSYLDIADVIERESARPTADLAELWRRVAFSILVSNFDDHLRNHGFLRTTTAGWELSPAFDLNPVPRGPRLLSTAIDFSHREARVDLLMAVAPEFRLGEEAARSALAEVVSAIADWRVVAARAGLSDREVREMAPAFEHGQARRAAELSAPR